VGHVDSKSINALHDPVLILAKHAQPEIEVLDHVLAKGGVGVVEFRGIRPVGVVHECSGRAPDVVLRIVFDPAVVPTGVVRHHIEQELESISVCGANAGAEVIQGTVLRVNAPVISNRIRRTDAFSDGFSHWKGGMMCSTVIPNSAKTETFRAK